MFDIGLSKMALIGAVALVVIGPEKLPRVARTVGTLLGKAQRYVSDVKAEVNRSMELDELRKMKDTVEGAARDVEQSIHTSAANFEKDWNESTASLNGTSSSYDSSSYGDRKSTRLNSSHLVISYAVFCLKKKKPRAYSSACSASPSIRPPSITISRLIH